MYPPLLVISDHPIGSFSDTLILPNGSGDKCRPTKHDGERERFPQIGRTIVLLFLKETIRERRLRQLCPAPKLIKIPNLFVSIDSVRFRLELYSGKNAFIHIIT